MKSKRRAGMDQDTRNCLSIRFYAQLNLFLPLCRRQCSFEYFFQGQPSVKHVIESLGTPHTEVDLILIDGVPADFSHLVKHGERVAVYPGFRGIGLNAAAKLQPNPAGEIRFILDSQLGKLARLLRLAGFDALCNHGASDEELGRDSNRQNRILLTRDRALLKRKSVVHGYHVWALDPEQQLSEVLQRFDLFSQMHPFDRCLLCNERLTILPPDAVLPQIPARVREACTEFKRCPACTRLYWKGTHYLHMHHFIQRIQRQS
jgi:uncharacterized protein